MKETEMKFEVRTFTQIRERLLAIGARLIWKGIEETQYYDFRDGSLGVGGISVRIREWKKHSISVTCKIDLKNSKSAKNREEIQFMSSDKIQTEKFFLHIGFIPTLNYKKKREHWEVEKHVHVELDELYTAQRFVEIEGTEKKIITLSKVLDVFDCPRVFKSYPEILKNK